MMDTFCCSSFSSGGSHKNMHIYAHVHIHTHIHTHISFYMLAFQEHIATGGTLVKFTMTALGGRALGSEEPIWVGSVSSKRVQRGSWRHGSV